MALSPELEQLRDVVKEVASIVAVAQHLNLVDRDMPTSGDVKIVCPFHPDTEPSCSLSAGFTARRGSYNTFRCYGCNKSGDVLDFWAEIRGYPPRGSGFIRTIGEVAQLFDLEVSARVPDWRTVVAGDLPASALQAVLDALGQFPVGPPLQISGTGGGTRTLTSWRLEQLPAELEAAALVKPTPGPVLAYPVTEFAVVALVDPDNLKLKGLLSTPENADFSHVRNLPYPYKGQQLNGRQAPADAPSLMSLRLATGNPLDAVALAQMRIPVRWGYWGAPGVRTALNQGGSLLGINCVVALLSGPSSGEAQQFFRTVTPGWGLRWLPRYFYTGGRSLVQMEPEEVLDLGIRAATESLVPEWSEPF